MSQSASPVEASQPSPVKDKDSSQTTSTNHASPAGKTRSPQPAEDTGPIEAVWKQKLLDRYTEDLSKLDDQEEELLHRLDAIHKLQLIWSTAGRLGEMTRSDKRIKTRTTKVLQEDWKLSRKRQKLSGAMTALQNVVGMLDENEQNGDGQINR